MLVGHSLAVGPGINPFGDEALALMPDWGVNGPCVDVARGRSGMTRVAALDCGTNSLRLLVADVTPMMAGSPMSPARCSVVRLGEGVDRTGELSRAALDRTFGVLREYTAAAAGARRRAGADGGHQRHPRRA